MKKLTSVILSLLFALSMFFTNGLKAEAVSFQTYDFSQMTSDYSRGTEYTMSGTSVNLSFGGKYKEIQFVLPETIDMSECSSVTFNGNCQNGKTAFKLYDVDGNEVAVIYDFKGNGDCKLVADTEKKVDRIGIMSMESFNFSATINKVSFKMSSGFTSPIDPENNLLTTYGKVFDKVGAALSAGKINNPTMLNYTKEEHNAITPGNEMKPDALLGSTSTVMSVEDAQNLGYYIPEGYAEDTVPVIDFSTVDQIMKVCYDNGMAMRGHTLVWHQQTPDWYFRTGYSKDGAYVSQAEMDKRLEFYVKTVMSHVYDSEYGSVVYAWDVVNEYLHGIYSGSGWQQIYGSNTGTTPIFAKEAFEFAYETLEKYGLEGKVKLFYNDYNTYMEVNDVINLINYINTDKKICDGIGMQSHLDTGFPSASYYKKALQAFADAGFEIQITELDATCSSESTQATYYYNIMKSILDVKKAGGNITAIIWWGLSDEDSWRSSKNPLLYSDYGTQKSAYAQVLKAYSDAGYDKDGNLSEDVSGGNTGDNTGSTGGNTGSTGSTENPGTTDKDTVTEGVIWTGSATAAWYNTAADISTVNSDGNFDSSAMKDGGYFYVEYTGAADSIEMILQSWCGGTGWCVVEPSELGTADNGNNYAKFSYEACKAVYGDKFDKLNKVIVRAKNDSITVKSVSYNN